MSTTCNVILPPFPFPESWEEIYFHQQQTGIAKWLVPEYDISSQNKIVNSAEKKNVNECDDAFEVEELVLNDEWAARLSKTVKRMKQKVHKAKQRAKWAKNK